MRAFREADFWLEDFFHHFQSGARELTAKIEDSESYWLMQLVLSVTISWSESCHKRLREIKRQKCLSKVEMSRKNIIAGVSVISSSVWLERRFSILEKNFWNKLSDQDISVFHLRAQNRITRAFIVMSGHSVNPCWSGTRKKWASKKQFRGALFLIAQKEVPRILSKIDQI